MAKGTGTKRPNERSRNVSTIITSEEVLDKKGKKHPLNSEDMKLYKSGKEEVPPYFLEFLDPVLQLSRVDQPHNKYTLYYLDFENLVLVLFDQLNLCKLLSINHNQ